MRELGWILELLVLVMVGAVLLLVVGYMVVHWVVPLF